MRHVVQWSGGIGSWAATELVRRDHPDDPITLLFADTKIEDSDLCRFNADASIRLGIPITRVCDGRTPFELFVQRSYLGNARIAPCSQLLKQKPCRRWLTEHTEPADTVLYVGLEPGEQRRAPAITAGWRPWRVEYPLMQHPLLTKDDLLGWCRNAGLEPPRLYRFGSSHNNFFWTNSRRTEAQVSTTARPCVATKTLVTSTPRIRPVMPPTTSTSAPPVRPVSLARRRSACAVPNRSSRTASRASQCSLLKNRSNSGPMVCGSTT
ncbi:hypothetical protein [Amycolatopsis sp. NPDC051061]|uniref:hypothetical protein n=1 Tax=Amycolatopsis sp. NPDC051061 TaxID=3155042 RepID=UPI00341D91C5